MSLASISIRNPVFAWMLMLSFIVFGFIGFWRLPVGQYPDIDFPIVTINSVLEGAAPETMETDVVDILEDAVMAVEGIREITSTSKLGTATINVEFELSRNIDVALQEVQARVAQAARNLPKDMDPPIINKTNPEENPIMWVALSGTKGQQEISEYAKNHLRDKFLTVEGNGDVMMGGYLQRNVRIWIDPAKLEAYRIGADDVVNAIQRQHVEVPAGRLEGSMREANVRIDGEALNVNQMLNLLVRDNNGAPVYLKDVALVEDGFEDRRRIGRANGFPAQGLGIIKQHGSNTVEVADSVRARLKELRKTLPDGLSLDVRVDNSRFIKEAVDEIKLTLLLSVLLTAFVCWLFLGSLSSTFNVVLAIPVSVFGTFAVMYFAGFSMNTFTLLALSLSIGIVVDDAIMVLENIYRHAEMGKNKVDAARDGTEQISFAALAATLAIIAIFLPVAFMQGIIGKFFFQFGVVLSVAVAISLLEAMTLAPARCAQFLNVGHRSNFIERAAGWCFDNLGALYRRTLTRVLAFRTRRIPAGSLLVLLLSLAIFSGSIYWVFGHHSLPREMVPAQDQGFYMVLVSTPVGVTVDYTDKVMKGVEQLLEGHDEIDTNLVVVGGVSGDVNAGLVFLTLKPLKARKDVQKKKLADFRRELDAQHLAPEQIDAKLAEFKFRNPASQQESIAYLRKQIEEHPFPGSIVVPQDLSQQGLGSSKKFGGAAIEFSIRGPDWEKLGKLTESFMEEMKAGDTFVDVDTDFRKGMPEVVVVPDRTRALARNVNVKALADTVSALVGGNKIARFKDNGRRYDVRARLLKDSRNRPEDIGNLFVRATDGKLVRLSEVATVSMQPSMQQITRQNRQRAVTIKANPNTAKGHSQADGLAAIEKMTSEKLPEQYSMIFSGNSRTFKEASDSLLFALGLGVVVAYMVLASQFNSFLHPLTVLLALPFSISGALLALDVMGLSLNIYSMIGIILLMGIVKKNSILLVDYTNQMRAEGKSRDAALIEACPARLRPILMTTFATIAGALPSALSFGAGGELLIPMSTAIIGGLALSTLLTLLVIPCFYSVVDEMKTGFMGLFKRGASSTDAISTEHAHGQ